MEASKVNVSNRKKEENVNFYDSIGYDLIVFDRAD
jgi:hypothetical protein